MLQVEKCFLNVVKSNASMSIDYFDTLFEKHNVNYSRLLYFINIAKLGRIWQLKLPLNFDNYKMD